MPWQWQRWVAARYPSGIRLPSRADRQPSQVFRPTTSLVFPCQDPQGNPLTPQVKKGDEVKAGSVLAAGLNPDLSKVRAATNGTVIGQDSQATEAGRTWQSNRGVGLATGSSAAFFRSARIYSPVAGKVVDITYRPGRSGAFVPVIAIAPSTEGEFEPTETLEDQPLGTRFELAAAYAGVDLTMFQNIQQLVVNGCDPDIGVFSRSSILREKLADVGRGATALADRVGARQAYLAITPGQLSSAELESLKHDVAPLQLLLVPAGYPAGRPEKLAALVRGGKPARCHTANIRQSRVLGPNPPAVHCLDGVTVVGVELVAALGQALHQQRPPAEVMVSIDGDAVARPGVYRVPTGTPLADLLEFAGLDRNALCLLVRGGHLAGQAVPLDDTTVAPDDVGFLALTDDGLQGNGVGVCLHCGRCISACPAGLSPATIARHARKSQWNEATLAGADRCFACGACAYACPSRLPLVQLIQLAQLQIEAVK